MNGPCWKMSSDNRTNLFKKSIWRACLLRFLITALIVLLFIDPSGYSSVYAKEQDDRTDITLIPSGISGNEDNYPQPLYIPELRPYIIDRSDDIWHARSPSSYITPDNDWVKHYASQLYVDHDGHIYYKNKKVPWLTDGDRVLIWTNEPFTNNYVTDKSRGNDHWQNADYYLTHNNQGDCEDWTIAVTSMMLSGEMSLKENNSFIKQKIQAKMFLGYINGIRDAWVEYSVNGKTYITSTSLKSIPFSNERIPATLFTLKNEQFVPYFELTDSYFVKVKDNSK